MASMSLVQALNSALDVALTQDPDTLIFGEDVGYFGGVFRVTDKLQEKHGITRCFDTPLSEGGIVATAIGMGAYGLRPVVEIQFADYILPAFDQLVSEAARLRYRSNGEFWAPITVRAVRRRHLRRSNPQPEPGSDLRPCRWPQDRDSLESLRCQGFAARSH
jgi:2-oxoisovalerate dehydrogenase E1 component beta subunit